MNRRILFERLEELPIPKEAITYIARLYERTQMTWYNSHDRQTTCVRSYSGILAGSTLSPTLWLLYIEPLLNLMRLNTAKVFAYVDDIAFLTNSIEQAEIAIIKVKKWTAINGQCINLNKSAIMPLNKGSLEVPTHIAGIPTVREYVYLGLQIRCTLGSLYQGLHALQIAQ